MSQVQNSSGTVQEAVYQALKHHILSMSLEPGTVMSTQDIAAQFEVSRTPVREAFIRLSQADLVDILPQRETKVSRIDLSRVKQERFIRESLELAVLEPFLSRCTGTHIDELRHLMEIQEQKALQRDFEGTFYADNLFHKRVFEIAGQELAWQTIESVNGHYFRVRLLTIWQEEINQEVVVQHRHLIDAYQAGDLDRAVSLTRIHLRKIIDEEKILLEKYPSFFSVKGQESDLRLGGRQLF